MDRSEAYEIASNQGFEGKVIETEQCPALGKVQTILIEMEDGSEWIAEVSEVNGCETFYEKL